jgi:hypothetical protein
MGERSYRCICSVCKKEFLGYKYETVCSEHRKSKYIHKCDVCKNPFVGNEHDRLCPEHVIGEVIQEELETQLTNLPTCPHCGYADENYGDFEDDQEYNCEGCGRAFKVHIKIISYFSTEPISQ